MRIVAGIVAFDTPLATLQPLLRDLRAEPGVEPVVLCNSPDPAYRENLATLGALATLRFAENRGFAAGHNEIFISTQPDWYICCNPDIAYRPGVIPGLIQAAGAVRNPGLVAPRIWDPGLQEDLPARPYLNLWELVRKNLLGRRAGPGPELAPGIFQAQFVSGCFFLIAQGVFEQCAGFDEHFFLYCEDSDLSLRVGQRHLNLRVPGLAVEHQAQQGSRKSMHLAFRHLASMLRYAMKHPTPFFGRPLP